MTTADKCEAMAEALHMGRIGNDGIRRAPEKVKRQAATLLRQAAAELRAQGEGE